MLFGHQTDDTNGQQQPQGGVNPLAVDPDTGVSLPVAPEDLEHDGSQGASVLDQPQHSDTPADTDISLGGEGDAAGTPAGQDAPAATAYSPTSDTSAPAPYFPASDAGSPGTPTSSDAAAEPSPANDDLLNLKQQALEQLSPLVDHLDQTPEEKFRTTMMMIQSTDNQALIQDAYAAAQQITDDKVRAQALLDIVNEINYFTQKAAS